MSSFLTRLHKYTLGMPSVRLIADAHWWLPGDQKQLLLVTFLHRMVNNDDDSEDADGLRELP